MTVADAITTPLTPQPAWLRAVFSRLNRSILRWHFHAVRVIGEPPVLAPGERVLFVANHVSVWDSLLLSALQHALAPRMPRYTALLAREYHSSLLFKLIDCLPITPSNPTAARQFFWQLRGLKREHAKTGFICGFFPQGRIKPSFTRPLDFKKGLREVAAELAPLTLQPVGIHLEPMSTTRSEAILSLGRPINNEFGELETQTIEAAVTKTLDDLFVMLNQHGEDLFKTQSGFTYFNLVQPQLNDEVPPFHG